MRKIVTCFYFWVFIFFSIGLAAASETLRERYPNRLITPDFGIVTADDLAYDAEHRLPSPYDPAKDLLARYWQCIPTHAVKRDYNASMGEDSMGPSGVETMMCDIEITADIPEGRHLYSDRRRHPNSFCQEFDRNWNRLTRGEKIVCFNGEDPSNENDTVFGKYRAWIWDKFKTRKGCYSYFGDCDVAGCAKGKCPK